ncbi:MAG TPA: hypothetical protein VMG60_08910 [Burkholderiaceae bacterium]|nr:hypothetical protein [Burkholderiaceae bacterium]
MNAEQALAFVRVHGVVLVAGKGPVPRLVEAIAGEAITGSWWSHPQGRQIFATLQAVLASGDVLVCRLVDGKITLVHRRVWPALVRLSARFPRERLGQVHQEHTASGRHTTSTTSFPRWVPDAVKTEAVAMDEDEALALLGSWTQAPVSGRRPARRMQRAR